MLALRFGLVAATTVAGTALALTGTPLATTAHAAGPHELPTFDRRADDPASARERSFRLALAEFKARFTDEVVEIEPTTGTLDSLTRHEGALTETSSAPPSLTARRWLTDHLPLIGIDQDDLRTLDFTGQQEITGSTRMIRW